MTRLLILLVLGALSWGIVAHAPVYLPPLSENAPPPPEDDAYVFGFATLRNPVVRFLVIGRITRAEPAELRGWARNRRDLRDAPEQLLQGVRFRVTPDEMIRLDRYERTGTRYRRDLLPLEDGTLAWVYRLIGEAGSVALQD
ncbi:MAG: gamma-glutamylcyclotransferase family protein [Roseinatronobacter sp.]